MTGSSSKLLQIEGKWCRERNQKKKLRQKKKNYSTPFINPPGRRCSQMSSFLVDTFSRFLADDLQVSRRNATKMWPPLLPLLDSLHPCLRPVIQTLRRSCHSCASVLLPTGSRVHIISITLLSTGVAQPTCPRR